jgi:hypothetical protein
MTARLRSGRKFISPDEKLWGVSQSCISFHELQLLEGCNDEPCNLRQVWESKQRSRDDQMERPISRTEPLIACHLKREVCRRRGHLQPNLSQGDSAPGGFRQEPQRMNCLRGCPPCRPHAMDEAT